MREMNNWEILHCVECVQKPQTHTQTLTLLIFTQFSDLPMSDVGKISFSPDRCSATHVSFTAGSAALYMAVPSAAQNGNALLFQHYTLHVRDVSRSIMILASACASTGKDSVSAVAFFQNTETWCGVHEDQFIVLVQWKTASWVHCRYQSVYY